MKFLYILFFTPVFLYSQEETITRDTILLNDIEITKNKKLKASLQYDELSDIPNMGGYSYGMAVDNGNLYLMNGDVSESGFNGFGNQVYIYDIKKNNWKISNKKGSEVTDNYIAAHEGMLYSFGGRKRGNNRYREYLNDKIDVYNIDKDTMTLVNNMPHQAVNFAGVKLNDKLLFFGGSTSINNINQKIYTDKIHLLNMSTGLWYELDSMPDAKETTGVIVDNKVYLIGGFKSKPLKVVESYNLNDGKWKEEFNLPKAMEKPSLAVKDKIIYIYQNGIFYTYDTITKILREYIINNIFSTKSQIFIHEDNLYILGGLNERTGGTGEMVYKSSLTSNAFYRIKLKEFNRTRVKKEVKF